jgi:hypothetical protein
MGKLSRRMFLGTLAGAGAGMAWGNPRGRGLGAIQFGAGPIDIGIAHSGTHPESRIGLKVADPARIKALQFTDLHFFATRDTRPENDTKTVEDLKRLVGHAEPDVLLISGDLWHDNPDSRGREFMEFAVAQVASLGVPWLFTWGNHDRLDDYSSGHDHIANAPHSLYRGGAAKGNYVVTLQGADGAPLWDLLCLNSGGGGVNASHHAWLAAHAEGRAERGAVPAMVVVHIPIKDYKTIWDNRSASGVRMEEVCFELEKGDSIGPMKAHGGIRAVFCGHDHVNDYHGRIEGIELVYGRASGHAGYGGKQVPKGSKLITINAQSGQYAHETLMADGTRWSPTPGMHIESHLDAPWYQPDPDAPEA